MRSPSPAQPGQPSRAERRALAKAARRAPPAGRRPRPATVPTIVALNTTDLELHEQISLSAILDGWATTDHFDNLADCCDLLSIGAGAKGDAQASGVGEAAAIALLNVKDRYAERGRFGTTGEERKALELLLSESKDFWSRQSGVAFRDAYLKLQDVRRKQREARTIEQPTANKREA